MCTRSQSGQIQVGPLLMPHLFSAKHSGQIWNPQPQLQQKGFVFLQQLQTYSLRLRLRGVIAESLAILTHSTDAGRNSSPSQAR